MSSKIKNLWNSFKKSFIEFTGEFNNSVGSALGKEKKFIKWAEENDYTIEAMEFSSFLEAGFSYWKVRRGHSCVKAVLLSKSMKERKGVYLMTAPGHGMQIKFVPAEEIKFKNPINN